MFYGVIRDCDTGNVYNPDDETDMSILCKVVNENERKQYQRVKALENVINSIAGLIRMVKNDD